MAQSREQLQLTLEPIAGPAMSPIRVFGASATLIGRAEACDVMLAHSSISRRHVSLTTNKDQWVVTDLGSRCGTFLNSVLLQPETPTPIASGDLLRIGPFTFRIKWGEEDHKSHATVQELAAPGTIVERVSARELDSLAIRRLELLIEGASTIHQATNETHLARAVLKLCLEGSGFRRAAVLGCPDSNGQVPILASHDLSDNQTGQFTFSRSLLAEAETGHVARLSLTTDALMGHSIEQLGIQCAICAPIMLDNSVTGYIYLDSREREQPGFKDATGFCRAVSQLAGLALANLKRVDLQRRQDKMVMDLEAARHAQAFLWPKQQGVVGRLKYAMRMIPGRIVAGDLFDILQLDVHRVAICFGDVSGQGMGAALLMTAVLAHWRAAMAMYEDPAKAIDAVNIYTTDRSAENMFVTLWTGIYDDRNNTLTYVDAGHGHWMIKRVNEKPQHAPIPGGILVGIDPDFRYEPISEVLNPLDRLVIYSDGMVEHQDTSGEQFGAGRLEKAIAESNSPAQDVEKAFNALIEYVEPIGLSDDTTLASIEVLDNEKGEE